MDIFHGDEMSSPLIAQVVNPPDIFVNDLAGEFHFVAESF